MTVAFSLISVLIVPPTSSFPFLLAVVRMLTYDPGNFCVTLVFFSELFEMSGSFVTLS